MKKLIVFTVFIFFVSCHIYSQGTAFNKMDQEPVWQENFTGGQLDTSKWNYEVNDFGGGNNELQYYTKRDSNIYVKDGLLHIRALEEDYKTRHYTSAKITSRGKGDFKFGRMEIRAKIPVGRGVWPAIWMMPANDTFGSWPLSGEIDIMETKGQEPDSLYGTAHFGPAMPHNRHKGAKEVRAAKNGWGDDFHVYAINWEKNKIEWFADGKKYFEITDKEVANRPGVFYPFNEPFYFILNLAIGGGFVGSPDDTVFPTEFLVDYIKVWQ